MYGNLTNKKSWRLSDLQALLETEPIRIRSTYLYGTLDEDEDDPTGYCLKVSTDSNNLVTRVTHGWYAAGEIIVGSHLVLD